MVFPLPVDEPVDAAAAAACFFFHHRYRPPSTMATPPTIRYVLAFGLDRLNLPDGAAVAVSAIALARRALRPSADPAADSLHDRPGAANLLDLGTVQALLGPVERRVRGNRDHGGVLRPDRVVHLDGHARTRPERWLRVRVVQVRVDLTRRVRRPGIAHLHNVTQVG